MEFNCTLLKLRAIVVIWWFLTAGVKSCRTLCDRKSCHWGAALLNLGPQFYSCFFRTTVFSVMFNKWLKTKFLQQAVLSFGVTFESQAQVYISKHILISSGLQWGSAHEVHCNTMIPLYTVFVCTRFGIEHFDDSPSFVWVLVWCSQKCVLFAYSLPPGKLPFDGESIKERWNLYAHVMRGKISITETKQALIAW